MLEHFELNCRIWWLYNNITFNEWIYNKTVNNQHKILIYRSEIMCQCPHRSTQGVGVVLCRSIISEHTNAHRPNCIIFRFWHLLQTDTCTHQTELCWNKQFHHSFNWAKADPPPFKWFKKDNGNLLSNYSKFCKIIMKRVLGAHVDEDYQ